MILTQAQETQINELRAQGLGYKLIGKTLEMSPDIVHGYLKRHGMLIVGDSYPTIEHVIPLCCGGAHAWSNVKLACFRCNTTKGRQLL